MSKSRHICIMSDELEDLKWQLADANAWRDKWRALSSVQDETLSALNEKLDAAREREAKLLGTLRFLRLYEMEPSAANIIDVALRKAETLPEECESEASDPITEDDIIGEMGDRFRAENEAKHD